MVPNHKVLRKFCFDCNPDHPLSSDVVVRLKKALEAGDERITMDLLCSEVKHVDAIIELSNDDWMKAPTAQLHPLVLVGPAVEKRQIFAKEGPAFPWKRPVPVDKYYEALLAGNLKVLQALMDQYCGDTGVVFEINTNELEWQVKSHAAYGLSGLWSLEYKRTLTNPLCISASHGHTACLRHLLFRRADPNAAPGGRSALHEACTGGHTDCAELLLEHKANPNLLDDDGHAPLHLCTSQNTLGCAKALVRFGALVNLPTEESQDTPIHLAAKHGLYEHVHLYLRYGATVDKKNSLEETALSVACGEAKKVEDQERYLQVCKLLLTYGAEVNTVDEEVKTPLHKASRNAHHGLVQLLLQWKADVNAIDYNGAYPMSSILQTAAFKQEMRPYLTVQTLLNHGSQKIWPTAFVKVLKSCASVPEIIEILSNSYSHLPISEKWVEVIPKEEFQKHLPFYESFFRQTCTVRHLQHLCRCAIRRRLGDRCHFLIPCLPVPQRLKNYLLLEPEGVLL